MRQKLQDICKYLDCKYFWMGNQEYQIYHCTNVISIRDSANQEHDRIFVGSTDNEIIEAELKDLEYHLKKDQNFYQEFKSHFPELYI